MNVLKDMSRTLMNYEKGKSTDLSITLDLSIVWSNVNNVLFTVIIYSICGLKISRLFIYSFH